MKNVSRSIIDQDLYYTGDETTKTTFKEVDNTMQVYVSKDSIYQIKKEGKLKTIIRYWIILLGEFFNG